MTAETATSVRARVRAARMRVCVREPRGTKKGRHRYFLVAGIDENYGGRRRARAELRRLGARKREKESEEAQEDRGLTLSVSSCSTVSVVVEDGVNRPGGATAGGGEDRAATVFWGGSGRFLRRRGRGERGGADGGFSSSWGDRS